MTDIKLSGFDLIEKIGEGGMGQVWKARQHSLDRIVAIKLLPPSLSHDPESIQQLMREARITAKLQHSGIIHIYDVCEQDGYCYLVMEFIKGYTIGQWLARKSVLPYKDALAVVESVATALKYAWHEAGLIHCDIKPENIMVDHDGTIKVGDLGLSLTRDSNAAILKNDEIAGTPGYISPEQVQGETPLDFRTDIYALGCCLYQMITGVRPFQNLPDRAAMEAHLSLQISDPREFVPQLPASICSLIEWMMVKNRDQRPANWDVILAELDKIQNNIVSMRVPPPKGASTMRRREQDVIPFPKSYEVVRINSLNQMPTHDHSNPPVQSNLAQLKVGLKTEKNSSPKDNAFSPEVVVPAILRGRAMPRKRSLLAGIVRLFGILALVMIALGVVCAFDLSTYRTWVQATEILPDLRKSAADTKKASALLTLSTALSSESVELKSGLLGILAVRQVGLGDQEGGIYHCNQVCRQFPSSWFASHYSEQAFYNSCSACIAKGSSPLTCPECKGSGKCIRCRGSGEGTLASANPTSIGTLRATRHTRKFYGLGFKCLDCQGTRKCPKCLGTGKLGNTCLRCNGQGHQFSQQKVIDLYKASIDSVMELHPPWVPYVVRLQTAIKSWVPFF